MPCPLFVLTDGLLIWRIYSINATVVACLLLLVTHWFLCRSHFLMHSYILSTLNYTYVFYVWSKLWSSSEERNHSNQIERTPFHDCVFLLLFIYRLGLKRLHFQSLFYFEYLRITLYTFFVSNIYGKASHCMLWVLYLLLQWFDEF